MHCGHFISRRVFATRWDEINCQVQSVAENIYNQGNAPVFAQKIIDIYGKGVFDGLMMRRNNRVKKDKRVLLLLTDLYKAKVYTIKKDKGIA